MGLSKTGSLQGSYGTEKTGKMTKIIPCQVKHREFENGLKKTVPRFDCDQTYDTYICNLGLVTLQVA